MVEINSTEFGSITIDGKRYENDVVVNYKGKIEKGWLQTRHLVGKKELSDFVREKPEIILIGNGQYGDCQVSDDFVELAEKKGLEVIIKETPEAIKKFNELIKFGKKVVAYMHVTC